MSDSIDVSISKTLFEQTTLLAQGLAISQARFIELAVEHFMATHQAPPASDEIPAPSDQPLVIRQGDLYWVRLDNPNTPASNIPHPHVVIQDDLLNRSRLPSVVVCALTSNLRRAHAPGNVLLEAGEANLPRQSVIEVSKVSAVAKSELRAFIGALSAQRVAQVFAGMRLLQRSFGPP